MRLRTGNYVKKEYRRQGLYSQMYRFVKSEAEKRAAVCGFRLYVEKDNLQARKTYETLGMDRTNYIFYEEMV